MEIKYRTHFVTAQLGLSQQRAEIRVVNTASATATTYLHNNNN